MDTISQKPIINPGQITVTSAVKLTPEQLRLIKSNLSKKMSADLPVVNKIDVALLGGFTVQVRDWFLDASLSNQMEFIKRSLLE